MFGATCQMPAKLSRAPPIALKPLTNMKASNPQIGRLVLKPSANPLFARSDDYHLLIVWTVASKDNWHGEYWSHSSLWVAKFIVITGYWLEGLMLFAASPSYTFDGCSGYDCGTTDPGLILQLQQIATMNRHTVPESINADTIISGWSVPGLLSMTYFLSMTYSLSKFGVSFQQFPSLCW